MQRPGALQQPAVLGRYVSLHGPLASPAPRRHVVCKDACKWIAEQQSLPSVVTSLPDITELDGSARDGREDDGAFGAWFSGTVGAIVGKLRKNSVALFYQTDTLAHSSYVDKSYLCTAGAVAAGGTVLFHKIALRHPVNTARFGKMPTYTHLLAYSGPGSALDPARIHATCSSAIADVTHRGGVAWARGMGVDAALGACRFVRDVVGDGEVCDPFCGTGTVLAAANSLGLHALGVELSSKRARHASVMEIVVAENGELVARRSTDWVTAAGRKSPRNGGVAKQRPQQGEGGAGSGSEEGAGGDSDSQSGGEESSSPRSASSGGSGEV